MRVFASTEMLSFFISITASTFLISPSKSSYSRIPFFISNFPFTFMTLSWCFWLNSRFPVSFPPLAFIISRGTNCPKLSVILTFLNSNPKWNSFFFGSVFFVVSNIDLKDCNVFTFWARYTFMLSSPSLPFASSENPLDLETSR